MSAAPAPSDFACVQHDSDIHALGMAINLLRFTEPFQGYAMGPFAGNLMGQIKRKHYIFTVAEKRILGYAGWALCSEAVAKAWLEDGYQPRYEECETGDCWVGLTWFSAEPRAGWFQARHLRKLYPRRRAYWRRDYGERQRQAAVFNVQGGESWSDDALALDLP